MWVVNPFQECTYVLSDETGEAVIVDCGIYYPFEREQLMEYIEAEHLVPVRLLLTHAHHDHVYGNDLIYEHFGFKLMEKCLVPGSNVEHFCMMLNEK